MNNCKPPTCVYSKTKKKCVKPNPYIQFMTFCRNQGKTSEDCKGIYDMGKEKLKANACNFYEKNSKNKTEKSCPKNRKPINNNCPDEYKVLKKNKYNIDCCYKEKIPKQKKQKTPENPFKLTTSSKKNFNEEKGKFFNIIYKYQNKPKVKKVLK